MSEPNELEDPLIEGLLRGDSLVIEEFCRRYRPKLMRLAKDNMAPRLRRRVDPEDVVQSVFFTIVRRLEKGEFQFAADTELWGLLCAITVRKVCKQAHFHLAKKRSYKREREVEMAAPDDSDHTLAPADRQPSAQEVLAFSEQLEQVLAGFTPEEEEMVALRLQDCTHREIAERVGCSEKTVDRLLKRVKARLTRMYEEP
jgi:RNA polymerase sigma factor (sigma-70 family)